MSTRAIRIELSGRRSEYDGDTSVITGNHEDLGRVTLSRAGGAFWVEAEDTSFARPFGVAMGQQ